MNTGIKVNEEVSTEFTALRMKRAHRFMIMVVNDDKTEVIIE